MATRMRISGRTLWAARLGVALVTIGASSLAHGGIFGRQSTKSETPISLSQIQQALDEQRYSDAGRLLDVAMLSGAKDPRLLLLQGELEIAHGNPAVALSLFKSLEENPITAGSARAGEGIALAMLKRTDAAVASLERSVVENPGSWRLWNALGAQYDAQRAWPKADLAYEKAVSLSNGAPIPLNNRGYSRVLQGRLDEGIADMVGALEKRPDFAEARTNLRLALALRGQYDQALGGGAQDPTMLNNAGFAATVRGEFPRARALFEQALRAKGEYYAKASENLRILQSLEGSAAARAADPR